MSDAYLNEKLQYYKDKNEAYKAKLPYPVTYYAEIMGANLSDHTLYLYLQRLHKFFEWLVETKPALAKRGMKNIDFKQIDKITADEVEVFLNGLSQRNQSSTLKKTDGKNRTRANYRTALNSFFKILAKRKKIKENVMDQIIVPRSHTEQEIVKLNANQEDRFVATLETGNGLTDRQAAYRDKHDFMALRDQTICLLLMHTGIRVSELVQLDLKDFAWKVKSFSIVRKKGKRRVIYMDDEIFAQMSHYVRVRNEDPLYAAVEPLFVVTTGTHNGERLSVRSVQLLVKKYANASVPEIAKDFHVHSMRATFASDMLDATNDLALVQSMLDHDSIVTTQKYYTGNDQNMKKRTMRNAIIDYRGMTAENEPEEDDDL